MIFGETISLLIDQHKLLTIMTKVILTDRATLIFYFDIEITEF